MTTFRIRYNRWWGPIFVVLAGVNAVVFAMSGSTMQLLFGGLLLLVGLLYWRQPFLVITESSVQAKNLVGLTIRRFPIDSLGELEVVPGGIVIDHGGHRQRLKLTTWMIARQDLDALARALDTPAADDADADAPPADADVT